ncbi:MAG TPA: DUF4279 domain-containing protein [Candidatus Sulfotelmatobacter sp.]|jgi:hypothetical protein
MKETRAVQSRLTPIDDNYQTCERTAATLRISTGAVHPEKVTELLGVNPTRVTILGERGPVNSVGIARVGKHNVWLLVSEGVVTSKDLRRHIDWIIDTVYPSKEALLRLQELPEVKMDVSCVWWSRYGDGGPTLWPEQMSHLVELNLEISIAFSFYGDEAEPDVPGKKNGAGK